MPYGVTDNGFVLKPVEVILEELASRQRAEIDPNWNTEADSLAGQYNGIFAEALAQQWEQQEALYYSLSRSADGAALDIIGALTGTPRRDATKSTVTLTLNVGANTTVLAGQIVSVDGDPSIRVVTLDPAINNTASAADYEVEAESETAGKVTANPGTLTVIETPVAGWNSVTNAASLVGGQEIEDDPGYRLRQLTELAAGGGGSLPGIAADLLGIGSDVIAVSVLENDTEVEVDGMPPKSIEAIVQGGDDQAIADVIFASKSGGIYTHGTEGPVTVTDTQGVEHAIRFSRPVERTTYIAIGITTIGNYLQYEAELKQAIFDSATTQGQAGYLGIGSDVFAARVVVTALGVSGIINAQVGLSFSPISDPSAGSTSLAIDEREIADVEKVNIVVSEL